MTSGGSETVPNPRIRGVGISFNGTLVRVLEVDPDLAEGVDLRELEAARQGSLASFVPFASGPWEPPVELRSDALAFFLLDGLLARRVTVDGRQSVELLGPGDVLSTAEWAEGFGGVPMETRWRVLNAGALVVLDRHWHERLARWPQINAMLLDRTLERSRSTVLRLALARIPNLSRRLRLLLWHLADRWGRVEPDGVVLPLELPQETLAELAAAQRESVSRALRELVSYDLLSRRAEGGWMLRGTSPAEIEALALEPPPDSPARRSRRGRPAGATAPQ